MGLRYLFPAASAPNSYSIPSLAPGLCPRPEHSVLLCPRHTHSHTHTPRRGGAYTSPPAPVAGTIRAPGPLARAVALGLPGVWGPEVYAVDLLPRPPLPFSEQHSPSLRVPLATLSCPITQPSAHLLGVGGVPLHPLFALPELPSRLSFWGPPGLCPTPMHLAELSVYVYGGGRGRVSFV